VKIRQKGGYVVFFRKFFVADSNQIAVSYCIGRVNSGIVKVPASEPIFAVGAKNMDFLVFCEFL
jgi:hypothetical protein